MTNGTNNAPKSDPRAPKVSQSGATMSWVPKGAPVVPKVAPKAQKGHLGKGPGTRVGPKVAQVPSGSPFWSGFGAIWDAICSNFGLNVSVFS